MILPDLITPHASNTPDNPAYIFKDRVISYGELNALILRCAAGLDQLGIKKGTAFAVMMRNCPEFVILSMALSTIGAVSVPINFLEKPERVALILNDAKAVAILTAKEFLKTVHAAKFNSPSLQHVFLKDGADDGTRAFESLLASDPWTGSAAVTGDDLMMLLYTSGTTGLPKGVMLTHGNFLANCDQCLSAISLSPKDRFLCLLPMFHSFAWTTCVLIPLKLGAPTIIIESLLPFDPVIKAIWKNKITVFVAVPQIFSALANKITGFKAFVIRMLNPVRIAISGAAPLPPLVHKAFESNLGVKLLEGYGLTEAAPVVALNPESKRKVGTVGKPLEGVTVELRGDDEQLVERGAVGEIWIRGANVMKGYFNKPVETTEVLTADGWLKTGDMGRFDEDGYLAIVDRKKDLIIVKGLNVYPQEVENVIAKLNAVREVAVVGKMDPETGDELIRAFVSAKEGATIDKAEIFAACREQLAAYKRPREVIVLDDLPKNALQKILKKDLRNL